MTILFGSVEFFEHELQELMKLKGSLKRAFDQLTKEFSYDFICEEKIKKECLNNLNRAYVKICGENNKFLYDIAECS